jgi:hypothetical protein
MNQQRTNSEAKAEDGYTNLPIAAFSKGHVFSLQFIAWRVYPLFKMT